MEMTTSSSVTSDRSGDPSFGLLLFRKLYVVARTITIIIVSIRASSSSWGALWWCRGHLLLRHSGGLPPRLHLLLRQGGRVLLLLLLASVFLLLMQAVVQSLQVARLSCHRAAQWTLRKARGQERDHRLTCIASKTAIYKRCRKHKSENITI
jgi:hypothetical protein